MKRAKQSSSVFAVMISCTAFVRAITTPRHYVTNSAASDGRWLRCLLSLVLDARVSGFAVGAVSAAAYVASGATRGVSEVSGQLIPPLLPTFLSQLRPLKLLGCCTMRFQHFGTLEISSSSSAHSRWPRHLGGCLQWTPACGRNVGSYSIALDQSRPCTLQYLTSL
jgi:hypothetical protein